MIKSTIIKVKSIKNWEIIMAVIITRVILATVIRKIITITIIMMVMRIESGNGIAI